MRNGRAIPFFGEDVAMGELRFDGQVAIVTGAGGSANLGRAHARLLAARGAKVVVNDLGVGPDGRGTERADAQAVAAEIVAAGGEAIADLNSVADEDSAVAIIQTALDTWGRIDILVNNAGVGVRAGFDEISRRDIDRVVGVHLMGAIWMCRAAWPHMCKAGYGRIVNTTSGGMMGMAGMSIYGAAKFGVYGLTRGLATEGAAHNIKVNALSPGAKTNSFGHNFTFSDAAMIKGFEERFPPDLVSPVVAYLAHEACAVTGALLQAGGGNVSARLIGATAGFEQPGLTIEQVRDNLSAIFDETALSIVTDPRTPIDTGSDPVMKYMVPRRYQPD
jgi:NAD(P)-dependent dehydrogenase (short-subunit alcohol dehydrogenase family)